MIDNPVQIKEQPKFETEAFRTYNTKIKLQYKDRAVITKRAPFQNSHKDFTVRYPLYSSKKKLRIERRFYLFSHGI